MFFSLSLKCDTEALQSVFRRLGFTVVIHNDLTAARIRHELGELGRRNFQAHDALVSTYYVLML